MNVSAEELLAGAGETAPQLEALAAPLQDTGSVPSTNSSQPLPGDRMPSSGLQWCCRHIKANLSIQIMFFNYMLKSQTCIGTHCHEDQIQNHSRDPCLLAVICLKGFLYKKRYSVYLCMCAHKCAMACMWTSEDDTF